MQNKKKKRKKIISSKVDITSKSLIFFIVNVLCLIGLFGVVIYIQVTKGENYEVLARLQQTNSTDKVLNPIRGTILDRNSQELAKSNIVYTIVVYPNVIQDYMEVQKENVSEEKLIDEKERTITQLIQILGIGQESEETDTNKANKMTISPKSVDELRSYFEPQVSGDYLKYKIIAKKVPAEKYEKIKEQDLVGVGIENDSQRIYPYNNIAATVVGFMGTDVGLLGIEKQYDKYLKGVPGRDFTKYTSADEVEKNIIDAENGDTIVTTIDANIQKFAEQAIENEIKVSKPQNAAIIVMDPNTGEILAMACSPGFSLNEPYNLSSTGVDSNSLTDEEKNNALYKMWRNYNISDSYEPGSTFKPIVVAAALEEGTISPGQTFYCSGQKKFKELEGLSKDYIGCWKKSGHGTQTLEEALANSCNVAMMEIGEAMGKELFYTYQKAFGFGEYTDIDLPGEARTDILLHKLEDIKRVQLATMSFGQTFNSTPLQLMSAFSAVINGGKLMKPYVVSQVIAPDGKEVLKNNPTIERKVISKETSDIVREYLLATVDRGTGQKVKIEGYSIGGKTGTAQQGKRAANIEDDEFVLSFVGFAPIDNPEVIALSLIDRPIQGDQGSAAPMLKELLENTLPYMNIERTNENEIANENKTKEIVLDDYIGEVLQFATSGLSMLNIEYEVVGTGKVITNQFPEGGTTVSEGDKVTLWVKKSDNAQKVTVTNLIDLTYDEAIAKLEELQIVPTIEGDQEGKVISQSPEEGVEIEVGGSVKLKFEK